MMQLLHHYQNTDGPYTCVPGKDQFTYCKGAYANMQGGVGLGVCCCCCSGFSPPHTQVFMG
jgi:hypothetical protein